MIKAKSIAESPRIASDGFNASNGWLLRFKKRKGISLHMTCGESGSADLEGVELARTAVPQLLEENGFQPKDVYNFDETAVFWRAGPSKTLATGGNLWHASQKS